MKNIFKNTLFGMAVAATLFFSCQKDLNLAPELVMEPYALTSLDENGGTWKPMLLGSGSEISVPVPSDFSSPEFLAELAAAKTANNSVSGAQKEAVEYWGANPVARWAQIASDLMAKYNLPVAPNEDGSYTFANADSTKNNPDYYPIFPFASPPYASRAYAYWGAAQFDALISAWHLKYQFNRPAAFKQESGIKALLPTNDLPAYPSEDAVIAAVSRTILTAMFPGEANYLNELAEEHKNSRVWAGMNVASDLSAGDSLGRKVAAKFLARAKADGMGKAAAVGPTSDLSHHWDSLSNAAQTTYGWHWESLDSPERPGMLPFFGRVKMWNVAGGVASVRPPAPPAVGSDEFNRNAEELKSLAKNPSQANRKLANFWADGPGTYTPPGHWAIIAAQKVYENKLNPLRSARIFAYVGTALMDAGIGCWDTKYFYHYPRPSQAIPGFKTILGIPNFPAYTSGHSTFSSAAATVLAHFFPGDAADFESKAKDASESRIVSGIHYRFDCETGLAVGKTIGGFSVAKAQVDGAE